MINTCFHIPTHVIYCSKLAGLQALLPSSYLSWHLYSAVFTFLPPYPYCKILFALYVDEIETDLLVPAHTVMEATELQKLIFLKSDLDVDS